MLLHMTLLLLLSCVVHLCAVTATSSANSRGLRLVSELRLREARLQHQYPLPQRAACAVTGAIGDQDRCTGGSFVPSPLMGVERGRR